MATMNVSLPQKMKDWVEEQVATGRYANASDYVRDIVRDDQQRTVAIADLQALVDEGIASGIDEWPVGEVFADIRAKVRGELEDREGPNHAKSPRRRRELVSGKR